MRRTYRSLILVFILMLTLNGCNQESNKETEEPIATVDNPFAVVETLPQETMPDVIPGVTSFGVRSDHEPDELGHYFVYEGGEMHMRIALEAQALDTDGVGILLFLDGRPQPYRLPDDENDRYMHTFYPPDADEKVIYEIIFTPITGEKGDTLEVGLKCITAPDFFIDDGSIQFVLSGGNGEMVTRLKFEATPDEADIPQIKDRVLSFDCEYVDMTSAEIAHWTSADVMEKVDWTFTIDGTKNSCQRSDYTGSEPLEVSFEIMGNPNAAFGLVIFVNHEPVCTSDQFLVDIRQGQKTIITAQLDMSDFGGEAVVYAVVVPRNVRIDALMDPSCYISATDASYFSN